MTRNYLVERYWPSVTEAAYAATVDRVRAAIDDLRGEGVDVRLVDTLFMPADEAVMYRIAADEVADVERTCQLAGLPFERITQYVDVDRNMR